MSSPKVFIFAPVAEARDSHARLETEGCELRLGQAAWDTPQANSEPELVRMAQGAHALMGTSIRNVPISRRIMESSPELRVVAKYTIGVDDIDVEAATEMGILVCHGPTESNWGGVAEGTITAMLAMLKKVRERDQHLKDGGTWRDPKLQGVYVGSRADGYAGITLGLIGLGRIGSRIATLLRPWKMRILAADPYVPESKFAEHGVTRVELSTLLRESDVVSLHVVLTRETRHLIGAPQLALMKHHAILINTSRGPCIQEPALIEALLKGQIGGAALDVFEEEPLALDSQLRNLGDRVLLSPHVVSNNVGSGLGPGIAWATESVLSALRGEVPDNVYNKDVIPRWQRRFGGKSVWKGSRVMSVVSGWEGRYFEDFNVGDVYRCRLGRTLTETDNTWFTLLTSNTNQIHFNSDYARRTEFGKCLINSTLTLAIVTGMGVADVSENGVALGWDEVKLPNPLFAGDTLYSESQVLEKRESRSNPKRGVVKVRTRGIQQEGKVVIDYVRSVLVWKKAHAPTRDLFPKIRE